MRRSSVALLLALVAASCGDGTSANDSGIDAGSDTECECESEDDNYCEDASTLAECDGCNFQSVYCGSRYGIPASWCEDSIPDEVAECESNPDCGWMDCYEEGQTVCLSETMLGVCNFADSPPCEGIGGFFSQENCYDPISCPGGSGCTYEGSTAECWCDTTVDDPDGGVDAGADGGV
jgi:hypothetical protein